MRPIRSEDDFQRWAQQSLAIIGHTQDHRHSALPHIPDMSAAIGTLDLWLELKYGQFSLSAGPEGRDYDDLEFEEVTRGQLDWLARRGRAGSALCGILGYLDIMPSQLTQYVFYMDADAYLETVYRKKYSVGAAILTGNCIAFDKVALNPSAFGNFLLNFDYPRHPRPRFK